MNTVTIVQWGIVVYWLAALADLWATYRCLKTGKMKESNKLANRILHKFGFTGLLCLKIVCFIPLMWLGNAIGLFVVAALWFVVAVRNQLELRKLLVR